MSMEAVLRKRKAKVSDGGATLPHVVPLELTSSAPRVRLPRRRNPLLLLLLLLRLQLLLLLLRLRRVALLELLLLLLQLRVALLELVHV